MEAQSSLALPKELNQKYEDAIRRNLDALMRSAGISQTQLVAELEGRGLSVGQGNLSQYLSGRKHIPLSLIVHLCDYFRVSLAELVDENFGGARQVGGSGPVPQLYSDDLLLQVPYLGDAFVIDPADPHFFGYLQTYYVYLFPSQAEEERIRTGTLKLMANGSVCEAVLEIDTNKLSDGKPFIKVYRGRCIISTTIRAVYILLTDPDKGELSVLNFRYFNLLRLPLDCRIACTLINATGEEHPPTVQRMFLSRTEIAEEHLPLLLPHLYLNSSIIRIRKEHLEALREENALYREPIEELMQLIEPTPMYCMDELLVQISARNLTKVQTQVFLSRIRSLAEHDCVNKASRRADQLSHKLLRCLGYFHDHDN